MKPQQYAPNEIYGNELSESSSSAYPVDLSNDIKVNQVLSEKIASGSLIQPEPEAELLEENTNKIRPAYDYRRIPIRPKYEDTYDSDYYHYLASQA